MWDFLAAYPYPEPVFVQCQSSERVEGGTEGSVVGTRTRDIT
jgi:hypothetical protein